jgi:hypothetical protein
LVVSPAGISSLRSSSSRIFGPPRTWQAEGAIERGHADDVDEGQAQGLGDLPEGVRREVVEVLLDVEEDGDEVLFEALVLVDDRLELGLIGVQIIPPGRGFFSGRKTESGTRRRRCAAGDRLPASRAGDYLR